MDRDSAAGKRVRASGKNFAELKLVRIFVIIGFSCLCGWELTTMFAPVLPILGFTDIGQAVDLYLISLVSGLAASLVVGRLADILLVNRRLVFPGGSLLSLVPIIVSGVSYAAGPLPFPLLAVSWVLLGVGQAMLVIYWSVFMSSIDSQNNVRGSAIGSALGTVLFVLVASIQNVAVNLLGTGLLLVAAIGAVRFLIVDLYDSNIVEPKDYAPAPALFQPGMFSAALNSSVYGFILIALFSFGRIPALIGAATGIFGALLAFGFSAKKIAVNQDMKSVQFITVPIIVAGLLLMPFFGEMGQIACCSAINAAHAFYRTSSIGIVALANADYNLHPVKQSTINRVPTLAGLLVGVGLGVLVFFIYDFSGRSFEFAMALIVIAITAAVSLNALVGYGKDKLVRAHMIVEAKPSKIEENEEKPPQEEILKEIAKDYRLSPRETEVFALLAKGRNAEHIQKVLVLASGTVKTHIHHIHQKTGASTQQQIIDIVEQRGGADDG